MMLVDYRSKKELKAALGEPLKYTETSMHGEEYSPDGEFVVAHRPLIQRKGGREFFATVRMNGGLIAAVK